MYKIFGFLLIILFTSCKELNSKNSVNKMQNSSDNKTYLNKELIKKDSTQIKDSIELSYTLKKFKIYNLKDTIKIDLNGDSSEDEIFLDNSKIYIIDGKLGSKELIGKNKTFQNMGDKFDWIDFWGITTDDETFEIMIEDGEIKDEKNIKLKFPSIFVRKRETGGGIISFLNNEYEWVHQSD